ncbi:chaperone modulator CbpM [Actimicrobium antarcticum]|uniref:MerR family transcriptional regulator n=1 Tax=Actimicrobium antarcticum TaxID=1051899 RepID=A0ABP7TL84_9BURK
MKLTISDAVWLDDDGTCTAAHLAAVSGLSSDELGELIDIGLVNPVDPDVTPLAFRLSHIVTVIEARRLRDDFELDRNGMALALTLLRRIDELQVELGALRALQNPAQPAT